MKKIFYIFISLVLLFTLLSIPVISSAAALGTIDTKLSKAKVAPGEEVTLTVNFGTNLGAYTVKAAYDNDIFDYVRSEGGTASDDGQKVILVFHDTAGGTNPRTNATITFKAKDSLTTSNPTNFAITLEGMSSSDGSVDYDDVTTPIEEDVLVEPNYVDYSLKLNYTGVIKKGEKKDMKLVTESAMGKNYDHVRLLAEVTAKPSDDATAKLIAIKDTTEIDILQSGWGDETTGYSIGGKNVKQELALKGEFSTDGKYTIKVKLVDRDNSDSVIAQESFDINVGEKVGATPTTKPATDEKLPATNPKTGMTSYVFIVIAISVLALVYFVISKDKKSY